AGNRRIEPALDEDPARFAPDLEFRHGTISARIPGQEILCWKPRARRMIVRFRHQLTARECDDAQRAQSESRLHPVPLIAVLFRLQMKRTSRESVTSHMIAFGSCTTGVSRASIAAAIAIIAIPAMRVASSPSLSSAAASSAAITGSTDASIAAVLASSHRNAYIGR